MKSRCTFIPFLLGLGLALALPLIIGGQSALSAEMGYAGLLTNVVRVTTVEDAAGVYTEVSTATVIYPAYLPLVAKNAPPLTVLLGYYTLVGNPCTTDPCLPCVIYAVSVDDTYYYLTVGGSWLYENRSWNGYTPEVGGFVRITGYVTEMTDIFGYPFYNIEVVSLEPASPPLTATSDAGSSPARHSLLLFGGLGAAGTYSDTWSLEGSDWAEIEPTGPTPFPRAGHKMVYDAGRNRVVLFGGNLSGGSEPAQMLNDTWEYVNGSWVRVETANAPSLRMLSAMAYDSGRGVTVLFGGYDGPWGVCATSAYTDTWEYDGTDWRRITTVHTPPQFVGGSMVYDESRGKIVLFTGWECQGFGWANETWEYDGTDWTKITSGPLGGTWRYNFAMAYDRARGRTVLFGGYHHGGSGGLNETWEYDGHQWTRINTPHTPPGRYDHANMMAYDETRQAIVLFGGASTGGYLADTWEYDGSDWQQISIVYHPSARKWSALVPFIPEMHRNLPFIFRAYTP